MIIAWEDGRIHYKAEKLTEKQRKGGVVIESLPEAEKREGKVPVLKVDTKTKEAYYEYVDKEIDIQDELETLKQRVAALETVKTQ
jgi:hypothetical protein